MKRTKTFSYFLGAWIWYFRCWSPDYPGLTRGSSFLLFYTVPTVFFHKYRGSNNRVTNFIPHFYLFIPTHANLKLANGKIGNDQGIGVVLYHFKNCPVIYPLGPVYYCPYCPSNSISSGNLKCSDSFQKVASEPLKHCDFVYPQGCYWLSPTRTQKNWTLFR